MSTDSSTTTPFEPTSRHHWLPSSMRSETASPIVSSGVRSANNWLIWNVRAMPRRTRLYGSRSVMSRPSSRMRPAVGRSTPVSRLMIVVLPAPFGPISAWRAPFSTDSETSLAARMPPKRFSKPTVCRAGATSAALRARARRRGVAAERPHRAGKQEADDVAQVGEALAPDEHQDDEHETDPELPILRRHARQIVLHQLEQDGADEAAVKIADAADDQHQQHVGGALEGEHVEGGELRRLGEQRAGDARVKGRDRIDRDQAAVHRDAHRRGAYGISSDGAQRQ